MLRRSINTFFGALVVAAALDSTVARAACDFDGTAGDYMTQAAALASSIDFAVAVAIEIDDDAVVDSISVFFNNSAQTHYWQFSADGAELLSATTRAGASGTARSASASSALTAGVYSVGYGLFVANDDRQVGFDDDNEGTNAETVTPTGPIDSTYIGFRPSTSERMNARLSYLAIFSPAPSAAEMDELYNSGTFKWPTDVSFAADLTHLYDFRSVCGATITDEIGALDLTNVSSAVSYVDDDPTYYTAPTGVPVQSRRHEVP